MVLFFDGAGLWGACQRSLPSGGAAYRMLPDVCQLTISYCQRQRLGSRSVPFEHIQPELGVVVSLIPAIIEVYSWSGSRSELPIIN